MSYVYMTLHQKNSYATFINFDLQNGSWTPRYISRMSEVKPYAVKQVLYDRGVLEAWLRPAV